MLLCQYSFHVTVLKLLAHLEYFFFNRIHVYFGNHKWCFLCWEQLSLVLLILQKNLMHNLMQPFHGKIASHLWFSRTIYLVVRIAVVLLEANGLSTAHINANYLGKCTSLRDFFTLRLMFTWKCTLEITILCILFFAQCLREPSNYSTIPILTQPCPTLPHWKLKAGEEGKPM